jgi:hypothetical protein
LQAGEDFTVGAGGVELTEQGLRTFAAESVVGADPEDITVAERDPDAVTEPDPAPRVGFTDQFRLEQAAEDMGVSRDQLFITEGGDIAQVPDDAGGFPEQEQQAIGGADPFGTETFRQDTGGIGQETAARSFARDTGGPDAILGPPGDIESGLGDVAFGIRGVSRAGADFLTEEVVDPGAQLFGQIAADRPAAIAAGMEQDRVAESIARGVGIGATEATVGLPAGAVETGAIGAEAAEFTGRQVEQQGVLEGGETAAVAGTAFATGAAVDVATAATERPAIFGGAIVGGVATGVGAGRAIQRAPDVARTAITRVRRDPVVDLPDEPDPPATTMGGLPAFSREAMGRGPRGARAEFAERAETGTLAETLDEPVAFSVRSPEARREFGTFGREFEAPAQDIEMTLARQDPQGQFFAADPSPLRLPGGPDIEASPSIGLPRPRIRTGTVAAEADPDLSIIPRRRTQRLDLPEQGVEGFTEGSPEVLGTIEFMAREADPSQRFIRGETLTPEQEAVAPPGARFEATGQRFAIRTEEGAVVPGRVFRSPEGEADAGDVAEGVTTEDIAATSIQAERRARARQPTTPVAPTVPGVGGPGATGTTAPRDTGITEPTGVTVGNQTGTQPTTGLTESPFGGTAGGGTGITDPGRTQPTTEPTETPTPTPTGTTAPGAGTGATGVTEPTATEPTSPFGGPTTGPSAPTGREPSAPSSPFGPTPTEPVGTPTEPPTGPPSEPPGTPTEPPTSPPSRPPGRPGGPPSGPPSSPGGGIPGTPTGGQPTTPRLPSGEPGDRDDEEEFVAPEGTPFVNPIATGSQLLFGDFGGGGGNDGENPDPTGLFLG